jgi:hypothetical protein
MGAQQMNRRRTVKFRAPFHMGSDLLQPQAALVWLTAAAATFLLVHAVLLPSGLVLPTLALSAFGCAAALLLVAWWRHAARDGERITLWDIAGASALFGFAAAALGEPDHVQLLFDRWAIRE